jgi:hypothetical protein
VNTVSAVTDALITDVVEPPSAVGDVTSGASDTLLQYGAIGALLVISLFGLIKLYQRIIANADAERQRADRAEAELRELHSKIQDRVLSTIGDATHAISEVIALLRKDSR